MKVTIESFVCFVSLYVSLVSSAAIELPTFTIPSYTIPSYTIPSYTIPSYTIPSYTIPSYTIPSYTIPSYTIPSYTIPSYSIPSYSIPSYSIPSYTIPSFTTLTFSYETSIPIPSIPFTVSSFNTTQDNKPLIHATPPEGWMNDPNGLWYDSKDELYHMYYQYNPNDTVWALPIVWGHKTSKNLTIWDDAGIAMAPTDTITGFYSGSVVVDYNNTSGFFNSSTDPRQRAVAIYTYNTPEAEVQCVAYSLDGGYSFIQYESNPVLSNNSTQFRDPKVIWHEESQKWIMTVAKTQEYKVAIYSSSDLKDWTLESEVEKVGVLGYQYECPGLAKISLPDVVLESGSNNKTIPNSSSSKDAWVLFISINPGAPQGGSYVEYFIGDFNGTVFTPFSRETQALDDGKDYYAFQTFFNSPDNSTLGVAWASNWQYGQYVPTYPWRSSMSLVRNLTLEYFQANPESKILKLKSQPVIDYDCFTSNSDVIKFSNLSSLSTLDSIYSFSNSSEGILEFNLTWSVNSSSYDNHDFADLSLKLRGGLNPFEYLRLGYLANVNSFFIDRGHSTNNWVNENPFYTNKLSVNLQPFDYVNDEISTYKVYGIIDRNIMELYFNDGFQVSTNTFFFGDYNYISSVELSVGKDGVFDIQEFSVRQLHLK
ncbi:hypothetical protein Kpol_234p2 [Vanderwaltozyma polyspora DSM 70294]|uniref:Beta-fructofuranosidase n=1 Tax=Vanderwaltozyma polyspora (strain ATCC 22028 / DSM 70294 / BCRC 21397 / CBS 2163 / NBRC 10782 / NRRL Y-8283 / UCD 57-17) TaxID=436907 RepID=A7TTH6_VANPO|nr:uncharacterized protein Kpol_234p2 [Vanderwaltozyma polyspora DSM 70294]EDO14432.1 hypothetical protein Kpol_234p2 [Vanderwaltozyma polyspora DSM 70294]